MRVLWVSASQPWPPDHATRNRAWHLLSRLAATEEVVAMAWQAAVDHPDAPAHVRSITSRAVVAAARPIDQDVAARLRRHVRALAGGLPPFVQAFREERGLPPAGEPAAFPAPWQEVVDLHRDRPFDVVVADWDASYFVLPPIDAPLVVHRHQVYERVIGQLRQSSVGRLRWVAERPMWRRLDRRAVGDANVATTPESAGVLAALLPDARVEVVPNGTDLSVEVLDPAAGTDVAVIGSMDYAPNADGVRWFVREAWPAVRAAAPDARLRVIGPHSRERLADLAGEGVELLGFVDDLTDALRGVRVGLAPLLAGMGIKTKVLDLLTRGLPAVTTPPGAEGLDGGAGALAVVEGAPAFAEAVVRLLADPQRAATMGRAGRHHVERHHSWDAAADLHRRVIVETVEAARRRRSGEGASR